MSSKWQPADHGQSPQSPSGRSRVRSMLGAMSIAAVAAAVPVQEAQAVVHYTVLHSFVGTDGTNPAWGGLALGTDGNYYGTTQAGGAHGGGTLFKVTPDGVFTSLYSFSGADGFSPRAGLVQATDGNFYGTTDSGGVNGFDYGTIFKVTTSGVLATLYTFQGAADGAHPDSTLIQGTDGNFYGTAPLGGASDDGTVFRITPEGTFTTLHSFSGTDGVDPIGGLMQAADGNFYGTTEEGGAYGYGTVFRLTPAGVFTSLHSFDVTDGETPFAALVQGADGNLYGTTLGASQGGSRCCGSVYKMAPDGTLSNFYVFTGGYDGDLPEAALIVGKDGNFYGTTTQGGFSAQGNVFQLTPNGTLTTWYSFASTDGINPQSAVVQGPDGYLYGTAFMGGSNNDGTVFKLIDDGLPAQPVNMSATPGNHQITVSWGACFDATSYNIYASTTPGGESSTPVKTGITATTFTFKSLKNRTPYYFKVAAVNSLGISALSNEFSATPKRRN